MIDENRVIGKLSFSYTDYDIESVTLQREYFEGTEDFGSIHWILDEFKYFLKALSFPESLVNRIVCLEIGDKILCSDGEVVNPIKSSF